MNEKTDIEKLIGIVPKYVTLVVVLMLICLFASAYGAENSINNPVHMPNRFPAHFFVYPIGMEYPESPEKNTLSLKVNTDYFAVYANNYSDEGSLIIDMEGAVLDLRLEYGLSNSAGITISIPFVSFQSGVMDNALGSFHDAFGFSNYGRANRPDDEFMYYIKTNGKKWFDAPLGGIHALDAAFSIKKKFFDKDGFKSSVIYKLTMPFGNEDNGLGSGGFGHGFFLPISYQTPLWAISLSPGSVIPQSPDFTDLDPFYSFSAHFSYMLSKNFSLQTGLIYYSTPFADSLPHPFDRDSVEWMLGMKYRLQNSMLIEAGFKEDITRAAPDFTFHLAFDILLGL